MPIENLKGKTVKGILTSEGQPMIGCNFYEPGTLNGGITNIKGEFEIEFTQNHPVIVITGFYSPICVRVYEDKFNFIEIENLNHRKSYKLCEQVDKYKKEH